MACDPMTMALVIGGGQAGLGILSAVQSSKNREAQAESAKINARLQRAQVRTNLQSESEASAQKAFELSRQALIARGSVKAANLADRSVRAIGRSVGFELGQDKATLARNLEIAAQTAAARLHGIDIDLAGRKSAIGSSSGLSLGLEIGSALLGAGSNVTSASFMSGLQIPTGGTERVTQLDASTSLDSPIA